MYNVQSKYTFLVMVKMYTFLTKMSYLDIAIVNNIVSWKMT